LQTVLAIDPGRQKCGIAVVRKDGSALAQDIIPSEEVAEITARWCQQHSVARLILGSGTGCKEILKQLQERCDLPPITIVEEKDTTRHARARYFHDHPPKGWHRLIPLGLQTPPRPIDDYAAILLAETFWRQVGRTES